MKYKFLLLLFFSIFFMGFTNAIVQCTPSTISTSYIQGENVSLSTICNNLGNTSVSITKTGSYFTIDQTSIGQSPSTKTITIDFDFSAPVNTHTGNILFSDSSTPIPILFSVTSISQVSEILVFPTTKIISVQQGNQKSQNILITVPQSYPRTITIQSVDLNPNVETISFSDLNLGQVAPGQSIQIPIIFSGIDASTGTYQTQLDIFATDSIGQVNVPSVSLQLQITSSINPSVNFSLSELPSCSLNANELNKNQTYTFTCSIGNPNIKIREVIDNFYLKGVNVQDTSSQHIYTFRAKNIGNTEFRAKFIYQESPIGDDFVQELKISPSGNSPTGGIQLKFVFYQNGKEVSIKELEATETIIQIEDNKTETLITDYTLYMGGLEINNTLTLEATEEYEMRVTSPGYLNRIVNFEVSRLPIELTISPNKTNYFTGDSITVTTIPENATILVNGVIIENGYTFETPGNYTIKAISESYKTTSIFIDIKQSINIIASSPETFEWKKGNDVITQLDRNVSWEVYLDDILHISGEGSLVEFPITRTGRYDIKSEGNLIKSVIVEEKGIFNWIKNNWLIALVILIVFALIVWAVFFRGKGEEEGWEFGGGSSESTQ